jgi:hypothetical protein
MTGFENSVTLVEFCDFMAGQSSGVARARVAEELDDAASDLSVWLSGLDTLGTSVLTMALEPSVKATAEMGKHACAPKEGLVDVDEQAIFEEIARLTQPYVDGRLPLAEVLNRNLVDQAYSNLYGDHVVGHEGRVRFFHVAGQAVAMAVAEHARRCLSATGGHQPDKEAAQEATAVGVAGTTLGLSAAWPERALSREQGLNELQRISEQLALVYTLSTFAGRTCREIADLLEMPYRDVVEAAEVAKVEVCIGEE